MSELPKYKCHKLVGALKIASVDLREDGADVYPADEGYEPFEVGLDWLRKFHVAQEPAGQFGYYVVYEDGYASWSPSKAFEEGYTKI